MNIPGVSISDKVSPIHARQLPWYPGNLRGPSDRGWGSPRRGRGSDWCTRPRGRDGGRTDATWNRSVGCASPSGKPTTARPSKARSAKKPALRPAHATRSASTTSGCLKSPCFPPTKTPKCVWCTKLTAAATSRYSPSGAGTATFCTPPTRAPQTPSCTTWATFPRARSTLRWAESGSAALTSVVSGP